MSEFTSRVSATRCPDYNPSHLSRAVESLLSVLEPLPISNGDRVLLKPNCLSANHGSEEPVNTRAEVIEAVGQYFQSHHQVRLVIADSGGLGSYGKAKQAYALMGLDQVASHLKAELIVLEELGQIEITNPSGRIIPKFRATALLDQVEVIVNLPKMKTHLLTALTGSIKNYLGLLPGSLKRSVHRIAPSGSLMSQALVDIWGGIRRKVPRSLTIMDGIIAMEGAGPTLGEARTAGWLLASRDPVSLDVIAALIMEFIPTQIPTIVKAAEAGLGISDTTFIELLGSDWSELPVPGFRHPFTRTREWAEAVIPAWLIGKIFDRFYAAKPRVITNNCQSCGVCVKACPSKALSISGASLYLNKELCIECYCCLEHCPSEGLWVPRGLLDRIKVRKKHLIKH
jgi:uncharacterized protein (DUF362 family)/ferredoxin